MDRKTKQRIVEPVIFLVGIPAMLWFHFVAPFWQPLFFSVLLSIMLTPLYCYFCNWCEWWAKRLPFGKVFLSSVTEPVAAALVVLVAIIGVVLPLGGAIIYASSFTRDFIAAIGVKDSPEQLLIQEVLGIVEPLLAPLLAATETAENASESTLDRVIAALTTNFNTIAQVSRSVLGTIYTTMAGALFGLAAIMLSMFYFLQSGTKLLEYVEDFVPVRKMFVQRAFSEFAKMTRIMMAVTLIVGFVQGTIGGFGIWMAGIAFGTAIMWTIVMAFLSIVPMLGAGLVLGPTAMVFFWKGETYSGVIVLCTLGVVMVIDNILKSWLVGRSGGKEAALNGGFVMLGVFGGLASYNLIGMFAGPIIIALLIAMIRTYHTTPPIDEDGIYEPFSPKVKSNRLTKVLHSKRPKQRRI